MTILMDAWWALVRFGFRLLYNELAWTYDTVSWLVSLGDWRAWQRTALRFIEAPTGAPVLELAHGTGNLHRDLYAAGYQPVGVDLSPAMGRITRRKLHGRGLLARLARVQAQALPFPGGTFPVIVSTFPTDFIIDPATLAEVERVLQPGGRLIVVANGLLTGRGPLQVALEWAYRVTGQREPWPGGIAARFRAAGLVMHQARVPLPHSEALVIIAEKTQAG